MDPKPAAASHVTMTQIVLPGDTNALGTIFGGRVMQWIDIAASVAALRHSRSVVVTASIDDLHFLSPIKLGDIVTLMACVNYVHKTSMEVGVRVESEDPRTGVRHHTASAYVTMVALDDARRPRAVPPVLPQDDVTRRRFAAAEERRQARLALRAKTLARDASAR